MDTAIIIATIGFVSTVVTALIAAVVNLSANRAKEQTAAEEAAHLLAEKAETIRDETVQERFALKDDQIRYCQETVATQKLRIVDLEGEVARLNRKLAEVGGDNGR